MAPTPAEDPLQAAEAIPPGRADRERTRAWWCFGGTIIAVVLSGIWTLIVGTASTGGDESDLAGGWSGVLRNLPAYLVVVGVASLGVWFAARSVRHGAQGGHSVLVATSLMLLFALNTVTRDAPEVVMETRAATVTWLLFGVDVLLVAIVYIAARRWSRVSDTATAATRRS